MNLKKIRSLGYTPVLIGIFIIIALFSLIAFLGLFFIPREIGLEQGTSSYVQFVMIFSLILLGTGGGVAISIVFLIFNKPRRKDEWRVAIYTILILVTIFSLDAFFGLVFIPRLIGISTGTPEYLTFIRLFSITILLASSGVIVVMLILFSIKNR